MFALFLSKLKILLQNPMVIFVYGIISKWYIMVMIPALVVTFWVFKGLTDAGILQEAENVVSKALNDTKSIARHCVPKIANLRAFWDCIENPPRYEPTTDEQNLENSFKDLLDIKNYNTNEEDPYDAK